LTQFKKAVTFLAHPVHSRTTSQLPQLTGIKADTPLISANSLQLIRRSW